MDFTDLDLDDMILIEVGACNVCGAQATNKCIRCKRVCYCDDECRLEDLEEHEKDCEIGSSDEDDYKIEDEGPVVQLAPSNVDHAHLAVEVRRSKIHGRGVFASRFVRKGSRLCFFEGFLSTMNVGCRMRRRTDGTMAIVYPDEFFQMCKETDLYGGMTLVHPHRRMNRAVVVGRRCPEDETPSGYGVGQYINDGVKPEISTSETDYAEASIALHEYERKSLSLSNCKVTKHLWFEATRDIEEGEEVLTHYGAQFWLQHLEKEVTEYKSKFMVYALQEQCSKPFNVHNFFDYDKETLESFLVTYLGLPRTLFNGKGRSKSPVNFIYELMEEVNMTLPAAFS